MITVNLAGYNVDADVLARVVEDHKIQRNDLTPETLSAAYARISRDPRPVDELRKQARQEVEKARQSNRAIIFQMGHHSVAEHAVFNFDIMGISRLALEELEKFRLCSFTEKSQRYITLKDNFVVPPEIQGSSHEKVFIESCRRQFAAYDKFYHILKNHVFDKNAEYAADPKKRSLLEGWAKEDARYITPLATEAQLGMTVNARNLELMLRRFASHSLAEIRQLGQALYKSVEHIAPSIILFHKANAFDQKTYPELSRVWDDISRTGPAGENHCDEGEVSCVTHTPDADAQVAAALMHTASRASFADIKQMINNSDEDLK
ncbi:MAG: FAD-dependent thymidylate synthase, partial [Elusimicrobia bacterium]|nr:FAD-dependent thymidylate synthase [Elusimicrobiota bacterium]MBD3412577.1 FAD-dependent thymidylate synthase [Elusimicrobiota bacterium]